MPEFVDGLELDVDDRDDVVVAYIGGMSCGLAPSVEVGKGGDKVRVWITVHDTGDCDSMAQEGAVGFDLEPEFEDLEVTAHWG